MEERIKELEKQVSELTLVVEEMQGQLNLKVDRELSVELDGKSFADNVYKPVRSEHIYIRPVEGGKVSYTPKKPDVEKITNFKNVTGGWTLGAKITAINEELHNVTDLETKMEFLILKSKLLEVASLGNVSCPQCKYEEYLDYLN